MKKLLTLGTLLLSAAAAIGCSSVDTQPTNEETDLASAADSAARPTAMGAIHLAEPRTETLSHSALHASALGQLHCCATTSERTARRR